MQNEPIISNPNTTNSKSIKKQLNFKIIGIIVGALAIIVIAIFVLPKILPTDTIDFDENASSSKDLITENEYTVLEDFDLTLPKLSSYDYSDIQERIILFFTNAYPEISTLTVIKNDLTEETLSEESEETPVTKQTEQLTMKSDTNKEFIVNINSLSNLESYHLEITKDGTVVYEYDGNSITYDPLTGVETDDIIEAVIEKLPYTYGENDTKFELMYEGEEDKLTIYSSNCENAIPLAIKWVNNIAKNLTREATENDFVCEAE